MKRFLLLVLLAFPFQALSSEFAPEGFYDPEIYTLDNGMRVVLNERHGARNVAIRLNVGVGMYDFDCDHRETAHYLEHLLFTGTSKHSERELDEIIIHNGGTWNAETMGEDTVFYIDIFSGYTATAVETLHEIITDSQISSQDFERSKNIISIELGGQPTRITRFLHEHELVSSARDKVIKRMLPDARYYCAGLTTLDEISHQDILDAYASYYVPNNMTLIVTGDFDSAQLRRQIASTFGTMEASTFSHDRPVAAPFDAGPLLVEDSFSPIFGAHGKVELFFRTNGYNNPDYYVLQILETYFHKRMYEVIRVEAGLSYSPTAELVGGRNDGLFLVSAEVDLKDMDRVRQIMEDEVARMRDGEVSDEKINTTIRALLLGRAQGLESNSDISWHYVNNIDEVEKYGGYVNQEAFLKRITPADVRRVAERYLAPSGMTIALSTPTLSSNAFYLVVIAVLLILALFGWLLARRIGVRVIKVKNKEKF
jgi:zinc protease